MDITKYGSQLFIVLEQATVHLRQVQNTLTRMGKSAGDTLRRLQETIRPRKKDVRKLQATSLGTIEMSKDKIIKLGSRLVALAQVTKRLHSGQDTLTGLGRSVADKPQSLQQALRSRENVLRELLASSLDAIVVTNADGSLVAANSKALDLFGVTRTNMRQFTIDVFLSQIQQVDGKRLPFIRRETKGGKCEIRRLDGSLRVAEYSFVANVTPFRHLCRFRSATATDQ